MESLEDKIKSFLNTGYGDSSGSGSGSGSGYGSGDSSGYGSGYGSGDGSGYGYGSGYGDSSGSGSGYGYGSGYGDSSGSGYGSGYGSGDGYGYGSGDGSGYGEIKSYNRQKVYYIDEVPTLIDSIRRNVARGHIINKDRTITACFVVRIGNSFAHGYTLKAAHADALAKHMYNMSEEERIEMFVAEHPEYDKTYPCADLFKWHNILTGSCEMGRRQFCKDNDINLDADYSVRFFLDITKDSYGSNIIQKLIKIYESKS